MLTQSRKRSALVAPHQAGVADNIGCENCRQFALLTDHGASRSYAGSRIIEGWRQLGNQVVKQAARQPAHSGDCDRPFQPKVITDSGDRDHAVMRPEGPA
jgi:hypothetical protein